MVQRYATSDRTGAGRSTTTAGSILPAFGKTGGYRTTTGKNYDRPLHEHGMHIQQRNLNYQSLKRLVEKLEGLCWVLQVWTGSVTWETSMICAARTVGYFPSFTGNWTGSCKKMKCLSSCRKTDVKFVFSPMTTVPFACMRNVLQLEWKLSTRCSHYQGVLQICIRTGKLHSGAPISDSPLGKTREEYLPKEKGPARIDVVPGTHASGDFLAHLAFNHFVLNIPYYREMYRLNDHSMSLSRVANVSVAYHTLISTCRMNGMPALDYLKKFFREIVKGRRDYENLLPIRHVKIGR